MRHTRHDARLYSQLDGGYVAEDCCSALTVKEPNAAADRRKLAAVLVTLVLLFGATTAAAITATIRNQTNALNNGSASPMMKLPGGYGLEDPLY